MGRVIHRRGGEGFPAGGRWLNLAGMTRLQDYARQLTSPMELLGEVFGLAEADLRRLGISRQESRELLLLADAYFGPTSFTRRQRTCRATKHCLTTLKLIEKYVSRTKTKRDAWALRAELCGTSGDIDKLARTRLKEMYPPRQPQRGVRMTRRKGGPSTLSITGDSDFIADLHSTIGEDSPLEAVDRIFFRGGVTRPVASTNIVIHLDELDKILNGGGEEVTLQMTNGAEISGAKLVEKKLAEVGLVTLIHPFEGPVNLYRTSRFASEKQRLMAAAENPSCPWVECNYPADKCQVHHLQAWKHGGETNMDNLTIACPYHNGVNDDDPHAPPVRGRLHRHRGRIEWLPPWASPPG